jgi:hypothetical protein
MKPVKIIFSVLTVLIISAQFANAQLRKIPGAVTESFKTKYATASNVEWKDRLSSYVATFEAGGKKHDAYFDDDGTWKHTDIELEESELPTAVSDGFQKSKYTDWNIDKVEKIEKNDGNVEYRLHIKKGDIRKKNLLFNSEGRMLKDKITV